jgi:DHA2 family multidrug resistance protein
MLFAIPVVGQIYNRTSPRLVVGFGLVLGAITCFQMARFTLESGRGDILLPQSLQGIALACVFIPLNTVMLARVDRRQMSQATGLSNLVRQIGGSIGIAVFAVMLGRYTTQAKAALGAHVDAGNAIALGRLAAFRGGFLARGFDADTAATMALTAIDGQVTAQAAMLAFERAFWLAGFLFLVSVPLVFLLDDGPRHERSAAAEPGEQHAMEI